MRVSSNAAVLACATCVCIGVSSGGAASSSSQLLITGPGALLPGNKPLEVKQHRSSLFGSADYGPENSIQAEVAVISASSDSDFCPDQDDILKLTSDQTVNKVILLDGFEKCKFVSEAKMVAESGGDGLLVMENKCLRENLDKTPEFKKHCEDLNKGYLDELGYMSGNDNSISIPSMLISRYVGLKLKECYLQSQGETVQSVTGVNCPVGHPVIISMRWNLPQKRTVAFDLWTSSLLNVDLFVQPEWYESVMPKLVEKTSFEPHYFVWNGTSLGCTRDTADQGVHCKDACTNSGRYCHYDPDGLDEGMIRGRDVSRENMRQACAYEQVKASSKDQLKWWKYVGLFAKSCTGQNNDVYYSESCSKEYHDVAGLDFSKTMDCVKKNGGFEIEDGVNTMWEQELSSRSGMELDRLPTLIVNGKIVDFGASLKNVLSAICAGFEDESKPDYCKCVTSLESSDSRVVVDTCFDGTLPPTIPKPQIVDGGGVGTGTFLFVLMLVVGGLVGAFMIFRQKDRRRMRAEFHEDVRTLVGEYIRMDGDEGQSGSFLSRMTGSNNRNQDDVYQPVVELS